jgi:membrane-associated phospholipid phosphatase
MMQKIVIGLFFVLQIAFSQDQREPYTISWAIDGPVFGSALAVAFTAYAIDDRLPTLTPAEIQALNKKEINPIDRLTAGWYSKDQALVSDLLVGGSILSPLLFVFDPSVRNSFRTVSTMYLETVMFAKFFPSFGKGTVRRVRPYVYSGRPTLSEKQDVDALRSFYSGHATWAFATSMFFASVYTDFHPDSEYRTLIWGGAVGLASTVSLLRVTSGAHFLSDIAVGAAVGSAIGLFVPYVHRTKNESITLRPMLGPDFSGASLTFHLK